ncbi:hypothetical protein [Eggerthella guodeyinii]|uniref:Uncharacterized protein n=1 Tax=Eggerthella guodeyinii TaxID=2690837 RepID=A0A6N7RKK4_9ACTN|nr:hypothetical protein [Eggerthella guodeyinii]MRX81789.1 hypothetical protein [Eggerthella guodeyinii]
MHSAKGHIAVEQRWKLQLAVAAVCRSVAPRPADSLAATLAAQPASSAADATAYRAISYYSYRYL